jgi:signal transduction histidine kinase
VKPLNILKLAFSLYFITLADISFCSQKQSTVKKLDQQTLGYTIFFEQNGKLVPLKIEEEYTFTSAGISKKLNTNSIRDLWISINFEPGNEEFGIIQIFCPNITSLSLFAYQGKQILPGNFKNHSKVQMSKHHRSIVVPPHKSQLIIKLSASPFSKLKIIGQSEEFAFKSVVKHHIYHGVLIGILLLLLLYHIILLYFVKEKSFMAYIFLALSTLIYAVLHWPGFSVITPGYIYFILLLAVYFSYYYFSLYYNEKDDGIKNKKKQIIPFLILLVLTTALNIVFTHLYLIIVYHLAQALLIIGLFIQSIGIGAQNKSVKIFSTAWLVLLLFQLVNFSYDVFYLQEWVYPELFTLGLALTNTILALAMANKLNVYKSEKKAAELSENRVLSEKESLIRGQNITLEKLIAERNKQLLDKIALSTKQQQEIESQNTIIQNRIRQIEAFNNQLNTENQNIAAHNAELEKQHAILETIVKKRTRNLLRAREKAIVADKLKTSFLNNLTQEINIPMNGITGYSSMITDKELSKETRNEYLNKIIKYVDVLLESVDNIVVLSRMQAGIFKSRQSEINFDGFVHSLTQTCQEKIGLSQKPITLETNIAYPGSKYNFMIDLEKTKQIIHSSIDLLVQYSVQAELKLGICLRKKEETHSRKNDKIIIELAYKGQSTIPNAFHLLRENLVIHEIKEFKHNTSTGVSLNIISGLLKILKAKAKIHVLSEDSLQISFHFKTQVQ